MLGQAKIRERFERAKAEGDLPEAAKPDAQAAFVMAVLHGMAVQAKAGVSRDMPKAVTEQRSPHGRRLVLRRQKNGLEPHLERAVAAFPRAGTLCVAQALLDRCIRSASTFSRSTLDDLR